MLESLLKAWIQNIFQRKEKKKNGAWWIIHPSHLYRFISVIQAVMVSKFCLYSSILWALSTCMYHQTKYFSPFFWNAKEIFLIKHMPESSANKWFQAYFSALKKRAIKHYPCVTFIQIQQYYSCCYGFKILIMFQQFVNIMYT